MTKETTKPAGRKRDPNVIIVKGEPPATPEEKERMLADTLLLPNVEAAATITAFNTDKHADAGIMGFVDSLSEQVRLANANDLSRSEAMLITQAHTLNAIFNNLARRSAGQFGGGYLQAGETYLRLALKAQSQSRSTLETLAEIKNPQSVAFVRQANIGENVQVNNAPNIARGREIENPPNKLLEQQNGERLDIGAPRTAIKADSELATVGKIDRRENGGR